MIISVIGLWGIIKCSGEFEDWEDGVYRGGWEYGMNVN